jgi:hypothetical protein
MIVRSEWAKATMAFFLLSRHLHGVYATLRLCNKVFKVGRPVSAQGVVEVVGPLKAST